ncbi:hypothetical protein ABT168_12785 [Streptomyces sp. NPDC001793]|uniref:tetratricopeptide repeat protein n=1 Tax=Streptomyces sp. NPDC001793 TaxID=3154657 RepID=UPI00331F1C3A
MPDRLQTPGHTVLTERLNALKNAALRGGKRTQTMLVRTVEERAAHTGVEPPPRSTVSDWFTGKSLPQDAERLWAVVEVLLEWTVGAPDRKTPEGKCWWLAKRQEWRDLWRQAQPEVQPADTATSRLRLGIPIADADPVDHLEVHPAIRLANTSIAADVLPLYVERAHDERLSEETKLVQERSRLVVLIGDSSTGKTRALWQAVRELPKGWRVWRPADRTALLEGLARQRPLSRTVLWLNELQRYLLPNGQADPDGKAASALITLLAEPDRGPVLIVGTLWHDPHSTLTQQPRDPSARDPHQQARALLKGSTIKIPEDFSGDDLRALRRLSVDDARLSEAFDRGGTRITQYLAGARELVHRYDHAPPEARAVLNAAADARRLGVGEDLPHAFLRAAAAAYLDTNHWRIQSDTWRATWFDRATDYTSEPCRGVPGLLTRNVPPPNAPPELSPHAYQLTDYIQQQSERRRYLSVPPTGFWEAAAEHLRTEEIVQLAYAAVRRLRLRIAADLFRVAAYAGNGEALNGLRVLRRRIRVPEGAGHQEEEDLASRYPPFLVAQVREADGDLEGAERAYRQAAEAGDGSALRRMLLMRESVGERERAEQAYRKAAEAGDTDALLVLALLRAEAGDEEGAERLCREAAETDHLEALLTLASIREKAGDRQGAERAYREAAEADEVSALVRMAASRREAGERDGAEEAYREAAAAGRTNAFLDLAHMHEEEGDWEAAEDAYREATQAGHTNALLDLARMREKIGDREGAERACREAFGSGHACALWDLAQAREKAGDREGSERAYREAADAGDTGVLVEVARMREEEGDLEGAELEYQRAIDAGDVSALSRLGWMREQVGDRDGAERAYREAADAGDTGALVKLALMWEASGDREGAERLYRQAADAGYETYYLWFEMWDEAGDREAAERVARKAVEAGATDSLKDIASMRAKAGDLEGAERLYQQAANAGDLSAPAALARLREEAGDQEGARHFYRASVDAGAGDITLPDLAPKLGLPHDQVQWGLEPDGGIAGPW